MNHRIIVAMWLLIIVCSNAATARTWKSKDGKSAVEAELVEIREGKAFLKKSTGTIVGVPIDKLSEEDQQFLKQPGLPPASEPAENQAELRLSAAAVEEALVSPVSCDFDNTPLVDVVAYFAKQTRVSFFITPHPLEEIGVSTNVPITGRGDKVPLATALHRLLAPSGLDYVPFDEVILITSVECAETHLATQAYEMLLPVEGDKLIKEMTSTMDPDSWEQVGGPGSSCVLSTGVLVVSHMDSMHRQIRARYKLLLRPLSLPTELAVGTPRGKLSLEDKLKQPTRLDFENTPLNEVVEQLRKKYDVQIVVDGKSLTAIGIAETQPVSIHLEASLRTALTLMLRELEITWYQEEGKLIITTHETIETKPRLISYPLRGLAVKENYSEWAEMIENIVQPNTWKNVVEGGAGTIESTQGGTLEILQTPDVHEEIAKLLAEIRKAKRK